MQIVIINGPNLNLLGQREPGIYGNQSFTAYLDHLHRTFPSISIEYFQNNVEGELINCLHDCMQRKVDGIVLNPGAYTHTSLAIADAVGAIGLPVIEVHISNVFAREEYRKTSFIASRCIGSISGLGLHGYELAIRHLAHIQESI